MSKSKGDLDAASGLRSELDQLAPIIGNEFGASRVSVFACDLNEVLERLERAETTILNMQVLALTEGHMR